MSEHDCLNNEDQLDSVLDEVAQIDSEFDSVDDIDSDLEKVVEVAGGSSIKSIYRNDEEIAPDDKGAVRIQVADATSQLLNDGDGTSPFVTEKNVELKFQDLVGMAPETLDTLEEIAKELGENDTAISVLVKKVENIQNSIEKYSAGEGLKLDSNNTFSITPSTEKQFGGVRIWEEFGYLCFSTEPYTTFKNSQDNDSLRIAGSVDAQLDGGILKIN